MPARQREAPVASAAAFKWANERIELCRMRTIGVGRTITLPSIAARNKCELTPASRQALPTTVIYANLASLLVSTESKRALRCPRAFLFRQL